MFDSTKKFSSETNENSYLAVSFQSTKMVVSKRYFSRNQSAHQKAQSEINFEKKTYNGEMSRATKAYLRKKLDAWYMSLRYFNKHEAIKKKEKQRKLVFFTVTLSAAQRHDDNEIKREILNSFIVTMKSKNLIDHYFWRAEKQRNGNIHFHFLTDCFIHKLELQNYWNIAQEKLGYVTEFEVKHGHRCPPSTQIQATPQNNNVIEYLFKYISKNDEHGKVQGRIWGMSDKLRELQQPSAELDTELNKVINEFSHPETKNVYQDENCMVISICHHERLRYYQILERYEANVFYSANYNFLYRNTDFPINVLFPSPKPVEFVKPEWIIEKEKKEFEKNRQYSLF
jgi:hypothetical protein